MTKEADLADRYFRRIRNRMIHQNKNWLAVVCGETGSGKSYSALTIADYISPRGITVKRNVVFNPKQLLELINKPERLKKGDIIVFDEAGVGMSSRDWYSVQNKLLGMVLQTFRNMNVGLIMTVPNLSFVDVQARKLLHAYFETYTIDYKREIAFLKVYDIQHNSRLDKTYYKHPVFSNQHGRKSKTKLLGVPKLRADLLKEYEEVKTAFTLELNRKALEEIIPKPKVSKAEVVRQKIQEATEAVKKSPDDFMSEYANRSFISKDLIKSRFGLSERGAIEVKKTVEASLER